MSGKLSQGHSFKVSGDALCYAVIIIAVVLANLLIMQLSSHSPFERNIYNSYALQAERWLGGELDLGADYSHLEIAVYDGKHFISFPPLPSFILLPFVLIFGTATPDHLITLAAAVIVGIYAYKLAYFEINNKNKALLFALLLCIGSNFLFLSNRGYVWFMAQVFAFAFTVMSLYYARREKPKPALSLFLFCCALGCRPLNAVYLPLLFYLLYDKNEGLPGNARKILPSAIPAILLGCAYMLINFLRFGSIFEFGHNYLPEFLGAEHGQFGIEYLAENWKTLWRLPYIEDGRLRFYAFNGTAFWLVSPLFPLYAVALILSVIKSKKITLVQIFIIITVSLHILLLCTHKTMGGWHFGHRYTVDALPVVFLGLLFADEAQSGGQKRFVLWLSASLLALGLISNATGTVFLYRGWL